MSRRPFLLSGVFLVIALSPAVLAPGGQADQRLARLYDETRFLELKALVDPRPANTPDLLFFKGMVARAFNRPAESAAYLSALLRVAGGRLTPSVSRDTLLGLSDDYWRLGRYAEAADLRDKARPVLETSANRAELAAFDSITALWRAMTGAPPQTVEIPGDTEIALTEAGDVPVEIAESVVPLLPDTGSSLSMIVRSDAERLGLRILDITAEIGTSTGKIIKARPCLVPEIRLGRVTIRNAVFLVVPEEMLYFPEIRTQRRGLMAFPLLSALKELTFTRDRRLVVSAPPRLQGPANIYLVNTDPVVEADYEGRRLQLFLDTGAFSTELFPRFFKAFEMDIRRRGLYTPVQIEGVGTRAREAVYLLKGLRFRVAGVDVDFDRALPVLTRTTGESTDTFDGSFSLDLLTGREALTINYESMRLTLR